MNRKIEILSPAGDIETLKTGVNAGADAIYRRKYVFCKGIRTKL